MLVELFDKCFLLEVVVLVLEAKLARVELLLLWLDRSLVRFVWLHCRWHLFLGNILEDHGLVRQLIFCSMLRVLM